MASGDTIKSCRPTVIVSEKSTPKLFAQHKSCKDGTTIPIRLFPMVTLRIRAVHSAHLSMGQYSSIAANLRFSPGRRVQQPHIRPPRVHSDRRDRSDMRRHPTLRGEGPTSFVMGAGWKSKASSSKAHRLPIRECTFQTFPMSD